MPDEIQPETGAEPTTETKPEPEQPTVDYSTLADLGDPELIRKQLGHAREWEKRAKANAEAAKKLEAFETERMTEIEKAVHEAEKRGRDSIAAEMHRQLAEARLRVIATGKVADVDALVDLVDVGKFVTDSGVDEQAINDTVDRFTKIASSKARFGNVELGPQGEQVRQITRESIKQMTPEQIVQAKKDGLLKDLLDGTSPS